MTGMLCAVFAGDSEIIAALVERRADASWILLQTFHAISDAGCLLNHLCIHMHVV